MRRGWVIAVLACGCALAQPLEQRLRTRIAAFPGTVNLYAKNLKTGRAVGIRESDLVRTASTIKLPIMMAVFDAVSRNRASWDEILTVTAAQKVDGTGILSSEFSDGVKLPLRDVVHLMIVLSDNTATNMVLERFTADGVNAYLDRMRPQSHAGAAPDEQRRQTQRPVCRGQTAPERKIRNRHIHAARDGEHSGAFGKGRDCECRGFAGDARPS